MYKGGFYVKAEFMYNSIMIEFLDPKSHQLNLISNYGTNFLKATHERRS